MKDIKQEAVKQAWDGAVDNDDALERLLDAMERDQDVMQAIMAPYYRTAAREALGGYKRSQRSYFFVRPAAPDNRVAMLAKTNQETMLDMRLPSGIRLGDAVKDDLTEAYEYYTKQAKYATQRSVFFSAVAKRLDKNQKVSEVWSASELEELRQ